ncbi:Efflux transporter, RND family, MFP subunit [Candidatus Sulfopaludibacter sp. SbA4]|nr:Efflux transporter, RND family, MFP subunit [Candidatus Sulfopaludibacter sp. SbA4]
MKKLAILLLIAVAYIAGFGYGRWYAKPVAAAGAPARKVLYWVDSMHPWYKSDKPGIAPDCGMKLVPVYAGDANRHEQTLPAGTVEIAPEKQQLIGVEFSTAQYETVTGSIHAAARVVLDETKIAKVQTRLEGWIDQVFVDFTGKRIEKGDPLLTLYSPEALATQQEYLLALKAQRQMHDNPMQDPAQDPMRVMMGSTENLVAAAKKRLELWDITGRQIDEVASTGKTLINLTLDSPISGFVMERNAFPKQHVTPDTVLYTVADLGTVWVIADVFEYEAANVRLNSPATLTLAYLPGRTFRGRVSYILPQVDPTTRTLKVRMQFDNPGYTLKPEMYGDVEFQTGGTRKLVVPQSAVLNSGDRQVVFLDRGNGAFEPREVKVGEQMENRVEILSGLQPGDRIVTSGNFLIDSESRLK